MRMRISSASSRPTVEPTDRRDERKVARKDPAGGRRVDALPIQMRREMREGKSKRPGLLAKRREKRRRKSERTGDTREKKGERPESTYDATDVADRMARGAGGIGGL
jgi:hypothetical protein